VDIVGAAIENATIDRTIEIIRGRLIVSDVHRRQNVHLESGIQNKSTELS
jgi:hypothetical protein